VIITVKQIIKLLLDTYKVPHQGTICQLCSVYCYVQCLTEAAAFNDLF